MLSLTRMFPLAVMDTPCMPTCSAKTWWIWNVYTQEIVVLLILHNSSFWTNICLTFCSYSSHLAYFILLNHLLIIATPTCRSLLNRLHWRVIGRQQTANIIIRCARISFTTPWSQKHASAASTRASISAAKVLFTTRLILLHYQALGDSWTLSAWL